MIKVYRQTDRIPLKIGDVIFQIKPLSYAEKLEITRAITIEGGNQLETLLETTKLLMKFCIKGVTGIGYHDGTALELNMEGSGLSDDTVSELMSMELTKDLNTALAQFANGIPDEIMGDDGKPMKHVKILPMDGVQVKKK